MVHRIAVGAAVLAAIAFASPARASVTASTVTSPANGAGFDFDKDSPGSITVAGTATADDPTTDKVRIVCTYSESPNGTAGAITGSAAAAALTPTGPHTGTFSVQVSPGDFDYYTCRLRAVPAPDPFALPADLRPFTGTVAHFNGHQTFGSQDFYQDVSGPLGYWDGYSTSDCFISATYTLDPATLGYSDLFGCADVSGSDPTGAHAALRIDGHDAFLPAQAHSTFPGITGAAPITGFTRSLDPGSGDAAFGGTLPALRCADGSVAYPPACPAWANAELSDRATTVGDHGGRLVRHTDLWSNPGTASRQLDVWYYVTAAHATAQWQFPGEGALKAHLAGDTVPAPAAGPGGVVVADDPPGADYLHPRGSVTWSSAPSELRFAGPERLYLHYVRTVPAGGAVPISLSFATDVSQASADALAADARSAMLPAVAITAPADGTTVTSPTVTLTGTASDDGPVSVQVDGHAATVAADRTWSVAVPLAAGANALTATATDADGNTATARRSVTLATTHPPVARPRPSNAFTLSASVAKDRRSVKLTLRLPGAGAIRATLKRTARKTTLATGRKTVKSSGKVTLTLKLSRSALKLLRSGHTLKARLSVTFTPTGGTARTQTKLLTLRARR